MNNALEKIEIATRQLTDARKQLRKTKRQVLKDLYNKCFREQQSVFKRIYCSVDQVTEKQIDHAIHQCIRTIEKNEKNGMYEYETMLIQEYGGVVQSG